MGFINAILIAILAFQQDSVAVGVVAICWAAVAGLWHVGNAAGAARERSKKALENVRDLLRK